MIETIAVIIPSMLLVEICTTPKKIPPYPIYLSWGNESLSVGKTNFEVASVLDKVSASGFIALQVHGVGSTEKEGREVKWRNVRILTKDIAESLKVVPATVQTLDFTK